MLILDTDHITEYQRATSAEARRLKDRLDRTLEPYATTIVTVEEIMRGWMAAIHRLQEPRRQIPAYSRLHQLFRFFAAWQVLEWNDAATDVFDSLAALVQNWLGYDPLSGHLFVFRSRRDKFGDQIRPNSGTQYWFSKKPELCPQILR